MTRPTRSRLDTADGDALSLALRCILKNMPDAAEGPDPTPAEDDPDSAPGRDGGDVTGGPHVPHAP